jgi:hypothetical protein
MNGFNRFLVAAFMSAAMLLPGAVQAMQIQQFDKMAQDDRAEYVGELIQGAEKVLTDEGRSDLAAQVSHLFTTNAPDGNISIGMSQFMLDLALARVADAKRVAQDPNASRLEVEHAMIVTLKHNGIILPPSFMTVNSGFQPKHTPPAKDDKDKKN